MVNNTLHRKIKLSNTNLTKNRVNTDGLKELVGPAPQETPVVLLLNHMIIIRYGNRVEHKYA